MVWEAKVEDVEEGVLSEVEDEAVPMVVEDTMASMLNQMQPLPKFVVSLCFPTLLLYNIILELSQHLCPNNAKLSQDVAEREGEVAVAEVEAVVVVIRRRNLGRTKQKPLDIL